MPELAQQYEQCGGDENYQGPTQCSTDLTCGALYSYGLRVAASYACICVCAGF